MFLGVLVAISNLLILILSDVSSGYLYLLHTCIGCLGILARCKR